MGLNSRLIEATEKMDCLSMKVIPGSEIKYCTVSEELRGKDCIACDCARSETEALAAWIMWLHGRVNWLGA